MEQVTSDNNVIVTDTSAVPSWPDMSAHIKEKCELIEHSLDKALRVSLFVIVTAISIALIAVTFLGKNTNISLATFLAYLGLLGAVIFILINERKNMRMMNQENLNMWLQINARAITYSEELRYNIDDDNDYFSTELRDIRELLAEHSC